MSSNVKLTLENERLLQTISNRQTELKTISSRLIELETSKIASKDKQYTPTSCQHSWFDEENDTILTTLLQKAI